MKRSCITEFNKVIDLLDEYDTIVLLRHVNPDGDALGSQWGLATWIKDNYPKKKVLCKGHMDFRNDFFPKHDEEMPKGKYLCIITDTAGLDRCDEAELTNNADKLIKIDHHGIYHEYGYITVQDKHIIATCQIIGACLLKRKDKILSKETARYLLAGIMTDSGKFTFRDVDPDTFKVVGGLLKIYKGEISEIALPLYERSKEEFRWQQEYIKRIKFRGDMAYAIIDKQDLEEIGVIPNLIKEYVFMMENIEGVEAWVGVTWFEETKRYRCSVRSKHIDVSKIAHKFEGGGHRYASGAQTADLKGLEKMFNMIQKAIDKYKAKQK